MKKLSQNLNIDESSKIYNNNHRAISGTIPIATVILRPLEKEDCLDQLLKTLKIGMVRMVVDNSESLATLLI